jgi:hypothetical protein
MIPRKQAGHMTATDHVIKTEIFLANTGPSTHDPHLPIVANGERCKFEPVDD